MVYLNLLLLSHSCFLATSVGEDVHSSVGDRPSYGGDQVSPFLSDSTRLYEEPYFRQFFPYFRIDTTFQIYILVPSHRVGIHLLLTSFLKRPAPSSLTAHPLKDQKKDPPRMGAWFDVSRRSRRLGRIY